MKTKKKSRKTFPRVTNEIRATQKVIRFEFNLLQKLANYKMVFVSE